MKTTTYLWDNEYVYFTDKWTEGLDLYIYNQSTADGYDVLVMSESSKGLHSIEDDVFYYQEGLASEFMDLYSQLREISAIIHIDDEELMDVLVGEIEEWEEHFGLSIEERDEAELESMEDIKMDERKLNKN